MSKEELQAKLVETRKLVADLEAQIHAIDTAPENNVFSSLEEAEAVLSERLREEAAADCEGSYNFGADEYLQEFIVEGAHYIGKLSVEYNRHDKTYYYVESARWSCTPKD